MIRKVFEVSGTYLVPFHINMLVQIIKMSLGHFVQPGVFACRLSTVCQNKNTAVPTLSDSEPFDRRDQSSNILGLVWMLPAHSKTGAC